MPDFDGDQWSDATYYYHADSGDIGTSQPFDQNHVRCHACSSEWTTFKHALKRGDVDMCNSMIHSKLSDPDNVLVLMMIFHPDLVSTVDWRSLVEDDIYRYEYDCGVGFLSIAHIAMIKHQWNVLVYLMRRFPGLATISYNGLYPVDYADSHTPRLITRMMAVSGRTMTDVPQMEEWASIPIADRIDDAVRCLVIDEPNTHTMSVHSHTLDRLPEEPPRMSGTLSMSRLSASSSSASSSTTSSSSTSSTSSSSTSSTSPTCSQTTLTAAESPIDRQCVICLESSCDATMLCGHAQFCYTCLSKVHTCPICREAGTAIKLYF